MRIGCCAGLEQIEVVRGAGYDYVELQVNSVKPESPEDEYEANAERIQAAGIVPETWNCMLPHDMKVVGPEVDLYRTERYLRTAFQRIEELGGETVVFGSGPSRTRPEGFPPDEARDQLFEFLTIAGQVAGAYGITIAVEPLSSQRVNTITSISQAVDLVAAVDHPFVKVLADLQHMMADGEPLSAIDAAKGLLVHAHVSDTGALHPGSGNWPIGEFVGALKSADYDDRLSVECSWRDFASECPKALDFLRGLAR